jgi:16S rRNA (cytidine1402-2'-O)-methyltransferase
MRTVSFTCRGHPAITATHSKTLEFTRDDEITARATCVLGVSSEHRDDQLLPLRGELEVTLECADASDAFTVTATPFFLGDDSLVFRRGAGLRDRTAGYDASKGAAEIDRALVAAVARRDAELRVTMRETGRGERAGALFVVAVPIGNDDDLSPRARNVIQIADLVLAEDTRRIRDLAGRNRMRIAGAVESYHEHNEHERTAFALEQIAAGARVALVSDAGTPLFSDPGYVLVKRAIETGVDVTPVPGPSSLLAVLSASGLPVDRFTYVGFLSRRGAGRRRELRALVEQHTTFVCHEAPHRIGALLTDLAATAPDWRVCLGREVTKVFEEFRRGSAAELAATCADEAARGEFTLVAAPPVGAVPPAENDAVDVDRLVRALLEQGVTAKTISHALAALPGFSRKEAYARVLAIAGEQ